MGFYKSFRVSNILTNLFSSKNLSKIVLFGVILLIIGMLFSNNVLAVEENEFDGYTLLSWDVLLNSTPSGGSIVTSTDRNTYYYHLDGNYVYKIYNTGSGKHSFYYSNEEPQLGVSCYIANEVGSGEVLTIPGNSNFYLTGGNNENIYKLYAKPYRGSDGAVDDMINTFSGQELWSQIGFAIPLIGVAVLFAIGFIVVRKLSKGTSKGKVKF